MSNYEEKAAALTGSATVSVVTGAGSGSPNLLLFTGGGSPPPPPPPPPPPSELTVAHIGGLSAEVGSRGKNWYATVTITVRDANGAVVAGASVIGNFTGEAALGCITGVSGSALYCTAAVTEVQDVDSFDVASTSENTGTGSNATATNLPDTTSSQGAVFGVWAQEDFPGVDIENGAGWTELFDLNQDNDVSTLHVQYKSTTAGSNDPVWSHSSATYHCAAIGLAGAASANTATGAPSVPLITAAGTGSVSGTVTITDVNATESWTDGDTGLVITGTGFV
jgi:hypothetical protein